MIIMKVLMHIAPVNNENKLFNSPNNSGQTNYYMSFMYVIALYLLHIITWAFRSYGGLSVQKGPKRGPKMTVRENFSKKK